MMALGSLTAVLVALVLRPLGLVPALLGGLCYAVFLPAVAIETTTRLEPLAACCLAAALVLLGVDHPRTTLRPWTVALAGGLLGYAATVKIWGALPLVVVALYLLIVAGCAGPPSSARERRLRESLSASRSCWRHRTRCGARWCSASSAGRRRPDPTWSVSPTSLGCPWSGTGSRKPPPGLSSVACDPHGHRGDPEPPSRSDPASRPCLLATFAVLLMSTPTWFGHYAGLSAGVLAITFGPPLPRAPCRRTSGVAPSGDWPGWSRAARDGGPAQPGEIGERFPDPSVGCHCRPAARMHHRR